MEKSDIILKSLWKHSEHLASFFQHYHQGTLLLFEMQNPLGVLFLVFYLTIKLRKENLNLLVNEWFGLLMNIK